MINYVRSQKRGMRKLGLLLNLCLFFVFILVCEKLRQKKRNNRFVFDAVLSFRSGRGLLCKYREKRWMLFSFQDHFIFMSNPFKMSETLMNVFYDSYLLIENPMQ